MKGATTKVSIVFCSIALAWLSFWYFEQKSVTAEQSDQNQRITAVETDIKTIKENVIIIRESQLRMESNIK